MGTSSFGNGQAGSATDLAVYVNSWLRPSIDYIESGAGDFFPNVDNIIYSQHINFCSVLVQLQPWKYQTNPLVAVFVALYLLPVKICWQKGKKTRGICTVYYVVYIPLITLSSNVRYGVSF